MTTKETLGKKRNGVLSTAMFNYMKDTIVEIAGKKVTIKEYADCYIAQLEGNEQEHFCHDKKKPVKEMLEHLPDWVATLL